MASSKASSLSVLKRRGFTRRPKRRGGKRSGSIRRMWSTHSVAHAMEMTGRHGKALNGLRALRQLGDVNNFKYHTWWHLALYYLEREDFVKVLDLFDTKFRKSRRTIISISPTQSRCSRVSRCAALISAGVGKNSARFARSMSTTISSSSTTRALRHGAGWCRAAQRSSPDAGYRRRERTAAKDQYNGGPIFRDVGLPLCRAIIAARNGEYGGVVDLLAPVRYQVYRIGGDHARRDLFAQLLVRATVPMGGIIWRALDRRACGPPAWKLSELALARPSARRSW